MLILTIARQKDRCKQLQHFSSCSVLMPTLTIANQKDRCKQLQHFSSCSMRMPTLTIANQKHRCKQLQDFSYCSILMLILIIAHHQDRCKERSIKFSINFLSIDRLWVTQSEYSISSPQFIECSLLWKDNGCKLWFYQNAAKKQRWSMCS